MEQLRDKALSAERRKELKAHFVALKARLAEALRSQEQALQAAAAAAAAAFSGAHPGGHDGGMESSCRRPAGGEDLDEAGQRPGVRFYSALMNRRNHEGANGAFGEAPCKGPIL